MIFSSNFYDKALREMIDKLVGLDSQVHKYNLIHLRHYTFLLKVFGSDYGALLFISLFFFFLSYQFPTFFSLSPFYISIVSCVFFLNHSYFFLIVIEDVFGLIKLTRSRQGNFYII